MTTLPLLTTMDAALALASQEGDNFYPVALTLQRWLAWLQLEAVAEYAEKKGARGRVLQTGQAWRAFRQITHDLPLPCLLNVLTGMLRLADCDQPVSRTLWASLRPLQIEHELYGDYLGPQTPSSLPEAEAGPLALRTVERWCDWIDADIHLHTHALWHHAPIAFDPDAEKRSLASLGLAQRHFALHADSVKTQWHILHALLSEQFKNSPKWRMVGQAMASDTERPWPYAEADKVLISLWPLLKRHNWTYRDLLNVVRQAVRNGQAYPFRSEQELATFCVNTLGLRKTGSGKTARDGRPAGYAVAQCLEGGASPVRPGDL